MQGGNAVVALRVPGGGGPYTYDGRPYQRHGPTTRVMPCSIFEQRVCETPQSRDELMRQLGLGHREHFRKMYLLPALETGLLERTIPDKPQSSKQRYRLTTEGHAWLRQQGKS